MTSPIPVTTARVAAIPGIPGAILTANVIIDRVRTGTGAGDGGVASLAQPTRAHCNFIEQAPLTLILPGFAATTGAATTGSRDIRRPSGRHAPGQRLRTQPIARCV